MILFCIDLLFVTFEKTLLMRKGLYLGAVLMAMGIFTACKSEPTVSDEVQKETCFYRYNEGKSSLEWIAFKTNDKVGVAGGFNEILVSSDKFEDPREVIESISFTINTASVETNNEERNGKIFNHFFETINTPKITGSIKSLGENGKAIIEITMNGISLDVMGDYELNHNAFMYETTIDVAAWNGTSGINALNDVCKDLHVGPDGVSKLWSEVQLKFQTVLQSDCE